MNPRQGLILLLRGLGGTLALALGIGVLLFECIVVLGLATSRDPLGKEPILIPLFVILGGVLVWIGVRELVRLRRTLGQKSRLSHP